MIHTTLVVRAAYREQPGVFKIPVRSKKRRRSLNKFRSRFPGRRQVSRVTPHTIQHGLWWHPLAQSGLPGTECGFLRVCPGTQRVFPPDLFEHIRIIHSSHRPPGVFRDYPIGFPLNGGIGFRLLQLV
ncbi:hypothetical protein FIC33_26800 [Escherichia coli]|nr:hypothetical protein FIC33_26800 [Escherichia coli]